MTYSISKMQILDSSNFASSLQLQSGPVSSTRNRAATAPLTCDQKGPDAESSSDRRSNATFRCYQQLLEQILQGILMPGQIVKLRPLAADLSESLYAVRQAADELYQDRLLERVPRRGYRVPDLCRREIESAYEVRSQLELLVVRAAIDRMSEKQLDALDEEIDQQIETSSSVSYYQFHQLDCSFHEALANAADKPLLVETVRPLIRLSAYATNPILSGKHVSRHLRDHRRIVSALRERNLRDATRLMKQHLDKPISLAPKHGGGI